MQVSRGVKEIYIRLLVKNEKIVKFDESQYHKNYFRISWQGQNIMLGDYVSSYLAPHNNISYFKIMYKYWGIQYE